MHACFNPTSARLTRSIAFALLCVGALASGCDDGGADADDGGGGLTPVESPQAFYGQTTAAVCSHQVGCCDGADGPFQDEMTCQTVLGSLLALGNVAHERGWLQFDGALAAGCVREMEAGLAAAGCDAELTLAPTDLPACAGVFVGLQGDGEVCGTVEDGFTTRYSLACAEGLICVDAPDGPPVCRPAIALGAPCEDGSDQCVDGYCATDGEEMGVCARFAAVGESCEAAPCDEDEAICEDGVCVGFGGGLNGCGF